LLADCLTLAAFGGATAATARAVAAAGNVLALLADCLTLAAFGGATAAAALTVSMFFVSLL
jgi:hypothetical protein